MQEGFLRPKDSPGLYGIHGEWTSVARGWLQVPEARGKESSLTRRTPGTAEVQGKGFLKLGRQKLAGKGH